MSRSSRLRNVVFPLLVLAVAAAGTVVIVRAGPDVEKVTPAPTLPLVRVRVVEPTEERLVVASQGSVVPSTESDLVAEVSGRIEWIAPGFRAGGFFRGGDELLRLDPRDYEVAVRGATAEIAQARVALAREEAEAELARSEWEELGRGEPSPLVLRRPQLEEARARLAAAEAALAKAKLDLERTHLVAPYDGRVRRAHVDLGEFVNRGVPLATIYGIDFAEVRLPVPDAELAYLDVPLARGADGEGETRGPEVRLRTHFAGELHEWRGRVVRSEGELDPQTRMVHLVAQVQDPYGPVAESGGIPLAVGMFVEAEILGRTVRDVVELPREALRGEHEVLVVGDAGRLRFRAVDVLRAGEETVLVEGGLERGERVVISPLDLAVDGMEVEIAETE